MLVSIYLQGPILGAYKTAYSLIILGSQFDAQFKVLVTSF